MLSSVDAKCEDLKSIIDTASNGEFVEVQSGVSESTFLQLVQSGFNKYILDFDNGLLRIRRRPSYPHERAATAVYNQMIQSLVRVGITDFDAVADNIGTTSIKLAAKLYKQPDSGFVPRGRRYPTVLVEVGWTESLDNLRKDARTWLESDVGVQMVGICQFVKLFCSWRFELKV